MRAPAPPYRGEGPHALWHVSEDPTITRFAPHRAKTALTDKPLVWATDTRHLPLFWFPRDCPRCTFWAGERTTDADRARFLDGQRGLRVHVIEAGWLARVGATELQLYRLPEAPFTESLDTAGYWMSRDPVEGARAPHDRRPRRSPRRGRHRPAYGSECVAVVGRRRGLDARVQRHPAAERDSATVGGKPRPMDLVWAQILAPSCAGSHRIRCNSKSSSVRSSAMRASSAVRSIAGS